MIRLLGLHVLQQRVRKYTRMTKDGVSYLGYETLVCTYWLYIYLRCNRDIFRRGYYYYTSIQQQSKHARVGRCSLPGVDCKYPVTCICILCLVPSTKPFYTCIIIATRMSAIGFILLCAMTHTILCTSSSQGCTSFKNTRFLSFVYVRQAQRKSYPGEFFC